MTDAFYVQYRCRSILLLSAIYEYHYNIVNLIFVCFCQLANTNKNEYNHCCYLYSLGDKQLCQNFEPNGLVTLTFDLLTSKVVSESRVTWATSVLILVFLAPVCSRLRPDVRDRQTSDVVRRQTRIIA